MPRHRLAAVVLAFACTSTERSANVEAKLAFPAPSEPVPAEAPAPVVASATYWQWDERVEDENRWAELPPDVPGADGVYRLTGEGPLAFVLADAHGRKRFERELPDSQHHDAGAMAFDGDAFFIAHHHASATGTVLTRVDANTGEVAWSTHLVGAGPIGHSKYRNRVQIAIVDHRPVVYGNESFGKYTEVVDPVTGKTIEHGKPIAELADAVWRFDRDPMAHPPSAPAMLATRDGRFVVVEPEDPSADASVKRERDDGTVAWSVALPGKNGCGRAEMLEIGSTLWIARWCAIASGASIVAVDAELGTVQVRQALRALPDVVHSAYRAELELREIAGHPVVFGSESAGRYIEALDAESGATVVSRTFR